MSGPGVSNQGASGQSASERARDGVTWVGHATVALDLGGVRLLTDPLLGRHAGMLRRLGDAPSEPVWQRPHVVLVSHLHHDHAELSSLRKAGAIALSPPANAHWLAAHGVPALGLAPDQWWDVPTHGDAVGRVRVRPVPAVHGHRPMPHRPNAVTGFVIEHQIDAAAGRTWRIWFAGDTEPYPDLVHLPELAGGPIDLALVPIGGWGPRLSGGHMDPVQAARACHTVGAAQAVPIHWGTLHAPLGRHLPRNWMAHGGAAFAAAIHREAPACDPIVLTPGQRHALT